MSRMVCGALLLSCTWIAVTATAEDQRVAISLAVPKSLPVDLPTVLTARVTSVDAARVLQCVIPGIMPERLTFQRDGQSQNYRGLGRVVDASLVGQTQSFDAQPGEAIATVAIHEQPGGLLIRDGERPVLFFQRDAKADDTGHIRAGYVHPLHGLDGEILTEAFPRDHRHHQGVFWAWHQLWVDDVRAGDPWETKNFLSIVRHVDIVEQGPVFATLKVASDWTSNAIVDDTGKPRPIVAEDTLIRVYRHTAGVQYIDFSITLNPQMDDVRLGGAENERGYSGFTVRVKPPGEMVITDDQGRLSADSIGRVSRWADVSGQFTSDSDVTGVSILTHPRLPEFPPKWLLRYYGMQNVVYPGQSPIALSQQQPLQIQHRLLIHRGTSEAARVSDHQRRYELQD